MKPSIYIYVTPLIPLLLLSLERFAGELSVVLKVDTLLVQTNKFSIFPSFVTTIIFIIIIIIIIILHSLTVVLV